MTNRFHGPIIIPHRHTAVFDQGFNDLGRPGETIFFRGNVEVDGDFIVTNVIIVQDLHFGDVVVGAPDPPPVATVPGTRQDRSTYNAFIDTQFLGPDGAKTVGPLQDNLIDWGDSGHRWRTIRAGTSVVVGATVVIDATSVKRTDAGTLTVQADDGSVLVQAFNVTAGDGNTIDLIAASAVGDGIGGFINGFGGNANRITDGASAGGDINFTTGLAAAQGAVAAAARGGDFIVVTQGATAVAGGNARGGDALFNTGGGQGTGRRGMVGPQVDNQIDLGSNVEPLRWRTGYFGTSVVVGATVQITPSVVERTDAGTLTVRTAAGDPNSLILRSGGQETILGTQGANQLELFDIDGLITSVLSFQVISGRAISFNTSATVDGDGPSIDMSAGSAQATVGGTAFAGGTASVIAGNAASVGAAGAGGGVIQLQTGNASSGAGAFAGGDVIVVAGLGAGGGRRGVLRPSTDNLVDLGLAANRWRTGRFGTSVVVGSSITIDATTVQRTDTGSMNVQTTNGQLSLLSQTTSVGVGASILVQAADAVGAGPSAGGDVRLMPGAGVGGGAAGVVRADSDNSRDLGSTAVRWRTGRFGTSVLVGSLVLNATINSSVPEVTFTGGSPSISAPGLDLTLLASNGIFLNPGNGAAGTVYPTLDNSIDFGAAPNFRFRTGYYGTSLITPLVRAEADGALTVRSDRTAAGAGTALSLQAAPAVTNGAGGSGTLQAGNAAASAGNSNAGGDVTVRAGNAADNGGLGAVGGTLFLEAGDGAGGGAEGVVVVRNRDNDRTPDFVPRVDNEGNVGTAARRWALVRATTITSGAYLEEERWEEESSPVEALREMAKELRRRGLRNLAKIGMLGSRVVEDLVARVAALERRIPG